MHADFHPNSVLTHRFAQAMAAAACFKEGGFGASQIFGLPEPDYGELIGAILKPASGSCARKGIRPPFAPPTQTTPRNCILSNWAVCPAGMTCTSAITAVQVRGVWRVLPGVYLLLIILRCATVGAAGYAFSGWINCAGPPPVGIGVQQHAAGGAADPAAGVLPLLALAVINRPGEFTTKTPASARMAIAPGATNARPTGGAPLVSG